MSAAEIEATKAPDAQRWPPPRRYRKLDAAGWVRLVENVYGSSLSVSQTSWGEWGLLEMYDRDAGKPGRRSRVAPLWLSAWRNDHRNEIVDYIMQNRGATACVDGKFVRQWPIRSPWHLDIERLLFRARERELVEADLPKLIRLYEKLGHWLANPAETVDVWRLAVVREQHKAIRNAMWACPVETLAGVRHKLRLVRQSSLVVLDPGGDKAIGLDTVIAAIDRMAPRRGRKGKAALTVVAA
jgi:hypothetical protein